MRKTIFLILILILNCKDVKKPFFKQNEASSIQEDFFINYAEKKSFEYDVEQIPEFGISIEKKQEKKCLYSNSGFFLNQEWGPKLGVCLNTDPENDLLLKEIFSESSLKTSGELTFKNTSLHIEVKSMTDLVNELSDIKEPEYFFGDEKLELALRKKLNQDFHSSISLSGISGRKIESSFGLPYFSIVKSELISKIIFPRKKSLYIVLDISKSEEIIQAAKLFFGSIEQKHSEILLSCVTSKLELSEIGFGKNEFIEWVERSPVHSCSGEVKILIKDKEYIFENPSGFYFAGATKHISEKSHLGENFPEFEKFWKDLKTESTIEIHFSDQKDSIQIPKSFISNFQEIEMSFKKRDNLCIWSNLYEVEKTCTDPGIDILLSEEFYQSQCDPSQFRISEMNPYGIRDQERINRDGKFIELQYSGNKLCKLAGLNLTIGSRRIPIFESISVKPNDLILIGKKDFFMQVLNLISYDIDFWSIRDRISLRSFQSQAILFKGILFSQEVLFEDKYGNVHSVFETNERLQHHKKYSANQLSPFYRKKNFMSPGELNSISENSASGLFSEINWAGAYKNRVSFSDEDFLEIQTLGHGSLTLEWDQRRFLFPVNSEDPYLVFAAKSLVCFPNAKFITIKDFSLRDARTQFKLIDSTNRILEKSYDPEQNQGRNDTSNRKRFSFVYTNQENFWRNSNEENFTHIDRICTDQTFASPDAPNQFAPFLIEESAQSFRLIASALDQSRSLQIQLYSYLPFFSQIENLVATPASNIVSIPTFNTSNSLLYSELLNGRSLNLFNRSGVFIEAVLPSPTNAQNEWILICNRSSEEKDLSKFEIEDEGNIDEIVSYFTRSQKNLPTGLNEFDFKGDSSLIAPNQCAYLIDPDATNLNLKPFGSRPTLIQTVKATSTIGNGISSGEKLDLFYKDQTSRIHIHSFGNKYSHEPFSLQAKTDEILFLKKNLKGESAQDYEVLKW